MKTSTLTPPEEKIVLSGISWNTYEILLKELSHRRLRLTYYQGLLEIMAPSPEHEIYKEVLGRFVETIAEELEINIYPLGSTTYKKPESSGAEPDKCFYISNINLVRGKKRLDLKQDPAPDLVIEVDITSFSTQRFQVYADLGVREIWLYNGRSFKIYLLQENNYILSEQSLAFPDLSLSEIAIFLEKVEEMDYLKLVKEFRQWVRSQIK
jgi:Uma2 family endonuclease